MATFHPGSQQRWERAGGRQGSSSSREEGEFRRNVVHGAACRDGVNFYPYLDPGRSDRPNWRASGTEQAEESSQSDRQASCRDLDSRRGGRGCRSEGPKENFVDRSSVFHPLLEGVLMEKLDEHGWMVLDNKSRQFKYFQDRNKVWPFWCKQGGADLLCEVFCALVPCLKESADVDARVIREGEQLYSGKPNLGGRGVAWSQEEYSHPGLQRQYVRFKSVQRFTETWSTLERAFNWGMLSLSNFHDDLEEPLRVASLGGGPGFELLAFDLFAKRYLPKRSKRMELFSLDLEPSWERYTKLLGLQFAVWDVNDGDGLLRKCPSLSSKLNCCDDERPLDLAIISYVYSHYMGNNHCADWLANALKSGRIKVVLVCSRNEYMPQHVKPMEERGIAVLSVLQEPPENPHDRDIDHRQLLFLAREKVRCLRPPEQLIHELTFPNVPFCEHRRAK